MPKVMVTLRSPGAAPTLQDVAALYGLSPGDLDETFGVVEIDPEDHAYTVLVEEAAAAKLEPGRGGVQGPFSNPRIAPFGPPEP